MEYLCSQCGFDPCWCDFSHIEVEKDGEKELYIVRYMPDEGSCSTVYIYASSPGEAIAFSGYECEDDSEILEAEKAPTDGIVGRHGNI
jgi:hypothetical protein